MRAIYKILVRTIFKNQLVLYFASCLPFTVTKFLVVFLSCDLIFDTLSLCVKFCFSSVVKLDYPLSFNDIFSLHFRNFVKYVLFFVLQLLCSSRIENSFISMVLFFRCEMRE